MNNKFFKFTIIIFIILLIDYLFSFFIKTKNFWTEVYPDKYWRIPSYHYHHDLRANVDVVENWGSYKYKLITNSLGFRDFETINVLKINSEKKRILLIGDSMTESPLDYSSSYSGLMTKYFNKNYEVLNAGVGSYSPSNYYYKIKYYLDEGYRFDHIVIFLDISDVVDELQYVYDGNDNLILNKNFYDKKISSKIFIYLRDNFITFRTISLIIDNTEKIKNFIKFKYKSSFFFKKGFMLITKKDVELYKMINLDIGTWTQNINKFRYNINNVNLGILRAEKNLLKLFNLAKKNKITVTLVIYPWPNQIYFEDVFYKNYWENFAKKNKVNFINLYEDIIDQKKSAEENILDNYIIGDIHFNEYGNLKIFNALKNKLKLN